MAVSVFLPTKVRFIGQLSGCLALFISFQYLIDLLFHQLSTANGHKNDLILQSFSLSMLVDKTPQSLPFEGFKPYSYSFSQTSFLLGHFIAGPILLFSVIVCIALFSYTFRRHQEKENQIVFLEKEKLEAELESLKSQISPHFIFNLLHSICFLARQQPERIEPVLVSFSKLLRFSIYDASHASIPLTREVAYIQSYIKLQQLRFPNTAVHFYLDGPYDLLSIQPMLLIPLVENAFKHGAGVSRDSFVEIRLTAHQDRLHFFVKNRYLADSHQRLKLVGGIGLLNVKKRLDLLYPDRHYLHFKKDLDFFLVELQLALQIKERQFNHGFEDAN
ncbi:sensor histidine kinase [Larkinella soli]|uniref:sensor histidine kinase n=1 Tax=Larkinella soli TaxID=1770527 RepID=UPI0013E33718|nr:histidine kinase [Larkinella soli]